METPQNVEWEKRETTLQEVSASVKKMLETASRARSENKAGYEKLCLYVVNWKLSDGSTMCLKVFSTGKYDAWRDEVSMVWKGGVEKEWGFVRTIETTKNGKKIELQLLFDPVSKSFKTSSTIADQGIKYSDISLEQANALIKRMTINVGQIAYQESMERRKKNAHASQKDVTNWEYGE